VEPLAEIAPPVTQPAMTVFVVSCFARALNHKELEMSGLRKHTNISDAEWDPVSTFSTTHSAAEKIKPITANVLHELQLLWPICFAV